MALGANARAAVTGAASGIGRAVARRCLEREVFVYLLDIEQDALDAAEAELSEIGHCRPIRCDVADADSVAQAADMIHADGGPLDLLVNNAGVGTYGPPIWELTHADWQWVLGVNLWGVINGLAAFLPAMVDRGTGHVVNVASAAGVMSPPGFAPYNASKHAVVTISETLFHELRASGSSIGVTVAIPGMVRTRMPSNERNRPAALVNPVGVKADRAVRYREVVEAMERANDAARDPIELADAILDAVDQRRFAVILDDWIRAGAEQRVREIVEGLPPTSPE